MGSLYLQGDWSRRELCHAFHSAYKTVKRHLAPLNLFLTGNPTPERSTPEEASHPLRDSRHSIERHFIRNALAAEKTQIKLFLFRSQVFFDGLPSSAEPGAVSTAAEESRRVILLLPPATLRGTRILGEILLTGLSSFVRRCEKVGHSGVFQAVSPRLRPGATAESCQVLKSSQN
jgi:hypothetical protein